ncbi:cryptochrome/photolyase family protein [Legionella drancourtii]|uniref:Deoxyribodipyrimidine photo-lyase n=1 Tax=Legionella drancourtii LLAP12 TaxID=658187 RepID=G9EN28_9GAMM|nr:deoxyribodipyrimidine photo-lyase [Legionella drancourtii]EHL31189.1 deoxyribodipyrimidine photolyase [Legionella drancourtii LLAP12]
MSTAIVWFRQDLRCNDNQALAEACNHHQYIIPLYIYSQESLGAAQHWWLHHSLLALQKELKKQGLDLCLKQGQALSIIHELIKNHKIEAVYWNRCYEPKSIQRDKQIKDELRLKGLQVYSFNGSLLNEPWTVKNKNGDYFKVFTPYWKQCIRQTTQSRVSSINQRPPPLTSTSEQLSDWRLLPQKPNWAIEFPNYWEPGEHGAMNKLNFFIEHHLQDYQEARNHPSKTATSRLAPHLHFGEISPWQVWNAIEEAKLQPKCDLRSADHFLAELGWREFSYYLLYHFPELPNKNFRQEFDAFPWQQDETHLKCWQTGMTGFPIVDAGMRELWHTGYMHNRVRMIVASFLIKDLMIDWRAGAAWFYNTLLDADLANNSASWQWVAGTGADSAPYFRIFNPTLQSEKFDPQGEYIKMWIPELSQVPRQWIHKPWEAPPQTLAITLGKDYPYPLVDHALVRKIALQHYQSLRKVANNLSPPN